MAPRLSDGQMICLGVHANEENKVGMVLSIDIKSPSGKLTRSSHDADLTGQNAPGQRHDLGARPLPVFLVVDWCVHARDAA